MSPTSYRAAPPRIQILTIDRGWVNLWGSLDPRGPKAVRIHAGRLCGKLHMQPVAVLLEVNFCRRPHQAHSTHLEIARISQRVDRQVPIRRPAQRDRVKRSALRREAD